MYVKIINILLESFRPGISRSVFVLGLLASFFLINSLCSQAQILPTKFDDFDSIHSWWQYHKDGTAALDDSAIVNGDGYLFIRLRNPNKRQECNVGISEFENIYDRSIKKLVVEARIKVVTPMKPGSRGWGFWKSTNERNKHSIAWFMEQLCLNRPNLSWKLVGTVAKKKRKIKTWQPLLNSWHIYRIERNLVLKTTRYWIDDSLIFQTPGYVPFSNLSFHFWIDNQIYSKTGIKRAEWQGCSSMVADYIKITTKDKSKEQVIPFHKQSGIMFYKKFNDVFYGEGTFNICDIPFETNNKMIYCLITAKLEKENKYDVQDELLLFLDDNPQPLKRWQGNQIKGLIKNFMETIKIKPGKHRLHLKGKNTPVVFDIILIDGNKKPVINKRDVDFNSGKWELLQKFDDLNNTKIIYLNATLKESKKFNHLTSFKRIEKDDDDLVVQFIDSNNKQLEKVKWCGNQIFGASVSQILFLKLNTSKLQIKMLKQGKPRINRLLILQ